MIWSAATGNCNKNKLSQEPQGIMEPQKLYITIVISVLCSSIFNCNSLVYYIYSIHIITCMQVLILSKVVQGCSKGLNVPEIVPVLLFLTYGDLDFVILDQIIFPLYSV